MRPLSLVLLIVVLFCTDCLAGEFYQRGEFKRDYNNLGVDPDSPDYDNGEKVKKRRATPPIPPGAPIPVGDGRGAVDSNTGEYMPRVGDNYIRSGGSIPGRGYHKRSVTIEREEEDSFEPQRTKNRDNDTFRNNGKSGPKRSGPHVETVN